MSKAAIECLVILSSVVIVFVVIPWLMLPWKIGRIANSLENIEKFLRSQSTEQ